MLLLTLLISIPVFASASPVDSSIVQACAAFAESIRQDAQVASQALLPFNAENSAGRLQRTDWHFLPLKYRELHYHAKTAGVTLDQLSPDQRALVNDILKVALSPRGFQTAETIRAHDQYLFDNPTSILRGFRQDYYGSDNYSVAIFGKPGANSTWMFRAQGHHLSVNVTVVNGKIVSLTPLFLGEFPTIVSLRDQEDAARALATSLSTRGAAIENAINTGIVDPQRLILTPGRPKNLVEPLGISYSDLSVDEATFLTTVVETYFSNLPDDLRSDYQTLFTKFKTMRPQDIYFRWVGGLQLVDPYQFVIQIDPGFGVAIEQQNIGPQHLHSVFQDFGNDFGRF